MPGEAPNGHAGDAEKPFWLARSTRTIFFFAAMLTLAGIYLSFKVYLFVAFGPFFHFALLLF